MTSDTLKERQEKDDLPQFIEVRTGSEFRSVHVKGSRNIPLDQLKEDLNTAALNREAPVLLICKSGSRSNQAEKLLRENGFDEVECVEGGTDQCEQAGVEVVRGVQSISLERQVRIAAGTLVVVGVALGFWVHTGFLIVSAFVGAGLVYAGVTNTCGMGMLLAKAPWNR